MPEIIRLLPILVVNVHHCTACSRATFPILVDNIIIA